MSDNNDWPWDILVPKDEHHRDNADASAPSGTRPSWYRDYSGFTFGVGEAGPSGSRIQECNDPLGQASPVDDVGELDEDEAGPSDTATPWSSTVTGPDSPGPSSAPLSAVNPERQELALGRFSSALSEAIRGTHIQQEVPALSDQQYMSRFFENAIRSRTLPGVTKAITSTFFSGQQPAYQGWGGTVGPYGAPPHVNEGYHPDIGAALRQIEDEAELLDVDAEGSADEYEDDEAGTQNGRSRAPSAFTLLPNETVATILEWVAEMASNHGGRRPELIQYEKTSSSTAAGHVFGMILSEYTAGMATQLEMGRVRLVCKGFYDNVMTVPTLRSYLHSTCYAKSLFKKTCADGDTYAERWKTFRKQYTEHATHVVVDPNELPDKSCMLAALEFDTRDFKRVSKVTLCWPQRAPGVPWLESSQLKDVLMRCTNVEEIVVANHGNNSLMHAGSTYNRVHIIIRDLVYSMEPHVKPPRAPDTSRGQVRTSLKGVTWSRFDRYRIRSVLFPVLGVQTTIMDHLGLQKKEVGNRLLEQMTCYLGRNDPLISDPGTRLTVESRFLYSEYRTKGTNGHSAYRRKLKSLNESYESIISTYLTTPSLGPAEIAKIRSRVALCATFEDAPGEVEWIVKEP